MRCLAGVHLSAALVHRATIRLRAACHACHIRSARQPTTTWSAAVQESAHAKPDGEAPEEAAAEAADDGPAEAQAEAAPAEAADGEADEGDAGEMAEAAAADEGEEDAAKPAPADGDDAPDAAPETEAKPAQVDPASMTVAQLKEQLADRGLSVQGRKTDLVARFTKALAVRSLLMCCRFACCLGLFVGCMLCYNKRLPRSILSGSLPAADGLCCCAGR